MKYERKNVEYLSLLPNLVWPCPYILARIGVHTSMPVHFLLALYLDQNVSTHLYRSVAFPSWFFTLDDWEFLCFITHVLKICHLFSSRLSFRAVSQRVLLTNVLKSWKFTFLIFRVLTLFFAQPTSFWTVNFNSAWTLHPRLPPALILLINSLGLSITINIKFADQSFLLYVDLRTTCYVKYYQNLAWENNLQGWLKHLKGNNFVLEVCSFCKQQ